jgi:hypothetical protein
VFHDFNSIYDCFCYHERLKPLTEVENKASSLINIHVIVILCIHYDLFKIIVQSHFNCLINLI